MDNRMNNTAQIEAEIERIREELANAAVPLPLTVEPNSYGHRIECQICGWSKSHGTTMEARNHVVIAH